MSTCARGACVRVRFCVCGQYSCVANILISACPWLSLALRFPEIFRVPELEIGLCRLHVSEVGAASSLYFEVGAASSLYFAARILKVFSLLLLETLRVLDEQGAYDETPCCVHISRDDELESVERQHT